MLHGQSYSLLFYFRTHCVFAVRAAGHGTSLKFIFGLSAFWNQSNLQKQPDCKTDGNRWHSER